MTGEMLKEQVLVLLALGSESPSFSLQQQLHAGTLSVLEAAYGPESSHATSLETALKRIRELGHPGSASSIGHSIDALLGTLQNLQSELAAGLAGSLQATATGEVLTDFIRFAKSALEEPGEGGKNVGAVLAAAAFEDVMRRLAATRGLPHRAKLADTLVDLKEERLLKGAQVGIAQSYLSFRNAALHAQWDNFDRAAVSSCLGFTEQILLANFT